MANNASRLSGFHAERRHEPNPPVALTSGVWTEMDRLEIRQSRFWRLAHSSILVIGFIYIIADVVLGLLGEMIGFAIVLTIAIAVPIAINLSYVNATRLIVDDKGISFRDSQLSLKLTQFPWQEIEDIVPGSRLGKGVVLKLHNTKEFKKRLDVLARLNLAVRGILWEHVFWIPLIGLDTPAERIETLMLERFELHTDQGANERDRQLALEP